VGALLIAYVFWRMNRYVGKYRDAKKEMQDYRKQIDELEQASTEVIGQSLKDKIEGITFSANPVLNKDETAFENNQNQKISELEDKVDRMTKRDKMVVSLNE